MIAEKNKLTANPIQPMHDRILVEREAAEAVTRGGIVIPHAARDKIARGYVRAIGEGALSVDGPLVPLQVAVGDRIIFNTYAGDELVVNGVEYLLMRESDILAIM